MYAGFFSFLTVGSPGKNLAALINTSEFLNTKSALSLPCIAISSLKGYNDGIPLSGTAEVVGITFY